MDNKTPPTAPPMLNLSGMIICSMSTTTTAIISQAKMHPPTKSPKVGIWA